MRKVSSFGKCGKRVLAVMMIFAMAVSSGTPKTEVYAEEQPVSPAGINEEVPAPTAEPQPEVTAEPTAEPTAAPQNTLVVKKKKCSYPKKIYEGQQFTLKGTLKANHKMQKVEASIIDARGKDTVAIKKKADSKKLTMTFIFPNWMPEVIPTR